MSELNLESSSFSKLPQELQEKWLELGFGTLRPVQEQTLEAALAGGDVLVRAPTGSGKTLAFVLPLIARIAQLQESRETAGGVLGVILCPTRELAMQVEKVFLNFVQPFRLRSCLVCGGMSEVQQKKALKMGVEAVIGTPGRVADLLKQRVLSLDSCRFFVLDEVDQMLQVGFQDELDLIREKLDFEQMQTLFFSATLDRRTRQVADKMLRDAEDIHIDGQQAEPKISHHYVEVKKGSELKALNNLLHARETLRGLIFCERKSECDDAAAFLSRHGFRAAALHGDLAQSARNALLSQFKSGQLSFLIATNVAARGIHVDELPLVVNLSVPFEPSTYVHRVGRTGRAGESGEAWTFVNQESAASYFRLCRDLRLSPELVEVPNAGEVENRHVDILFAESLLGLAEAEDAGEGSTRSVQGYAHRISLLSEPEREAVILHLLKGYVKSRKAFARSEFAPRRKLIDWDAPVVRPRTVRGGRFVRGGQKNWRGPGQGFSGGRGGGGAFRGRKRS